MALEPAWQRLVLHIRSSKCPVRNLNQQLVCPRGCASGSWQSATRPFSVRARHAHPASTSNVTSPAASPSTPSSSSSSSSQSTLRPEDAPRKHSPIAEKVAQTIHRHAPGMTETYVAYGATEKLYRQCAAQADYNIPQASVRDAEVPKTADGIEMGVSDSWWYQGLGLMPTFNNWAQVTMLHIYFFATRFRHFPAEHAPSWQQHLLDHFFHDAERHMVMDHRMTSRAARNKYLKDLFVQYRGALAAYDEGLCKGDAVLASALWRNLFAAKDDVDLPNLALIVAYFRNTVRAMEIIADDSIASGLVHFGDPTTHRGLLQSRSRLMDRPFADGSPGRSQEQPNARPPRPVKR